MGPLTSKKLFMKNCRGITDREVNGRIKEVQNLNIHNLKNGHITECHLVISIVLRLNFLTFKHLERKDVGFIAVVNSSEKIYKTAYKDTVVRKVTSELSTFNSFKHHEERKVGFIAVVNNKIFKNCLGVKRAG